MTYKVTQPPLRVDSLSWYPDSDGLRKVFTFVPPMMEAEESVPIPMYRQAGGMIGLPRECCPDPTEATDHRSRGSPTGLKLLPSFEFRDGQEKLFRASLAELQAGRSHIAKATTGFGKTALGAWVSVMLGRTTLIVVQKEDLLRQWRLTFAALCGLGPDDIGLIQQDECRYEGYPVTLAMVHSLVIPDRYPAQVQDYFGLAIFDEVHRMGADTFNRATMMFSAVHRLGLSATVDRPDGRDPVFKAHIGGIAVETTMVAMPPKVVMVPTRFKLPVVNRMVDGQWRKVVLPHSPGRMMTVYKLMAADAKRNEQISDVVSSCYARGRQTIVFAHTHDHLDTLFHMVARKGVPGSDMAYYVGTGPHAKPAERKRARETAKVIWGTYKMLSEGTDIPRMDCAVLATPLAHVLQPAGRVLREFPGKKQPVIWDFDDGSAGSSILTGFVRSRRKEYYSIDGNVLSV